LSIQFLAKKEKGQKPYLLDPVVELASDLDSYNITHTLEISGLLISSLEKSCKSSSA
jgi:hypothetical protein